MILTTPRSRRSTTTLSRDMLHALPVSQDTNVAPGPLVLTKDGRIKGITVDKAHIFYGIPYADPPVGAYRWKPPRPVSPWSGVYNASFPRPACMQLLLLKSSTRRIPMTSVSEDCLYLNIFVPLDVNFSSPLRSPLPVMVWIHGGDFIAGSASKPLYDGRFISNFTRTVLVSMEYRLGAFGFLVSGKDLHTSAAGNYGILDQQEALLWVQRNIAVFGGDPSKVTIFGESAGAQSVSLHLMIQSSKPLFKQAVLQSLPFSIPLKTSGHAWINVAPSRSSVCDEDPAVSRTLSSLSTSDGPDGNCKQLFSAEIGLMKKKKRRISARLRKDFVYICVDAAIQHEGRRLSLSPYINVQNYHHRSAHFTDSSFKTDVLFIFCPQIVTDYVFLCPSRRSARAGTAVGSKLWMYVFDHTASDHRVWSGLTFCYQHACHGAELPFLFDSAAVANFTLMPSEKLLSNRMLCYWGAFAHTGDPSSRVQQTTFCREQRLPVWPRYSDTSGWLVMNLTVRSHAQVGTRNHMCDFWDQLGIY
uniref:Carboxylic ester hydrolase n=1 Tax=Seriola dumerili TaxID=41447 RepID=A0A3B4UXN2_SERDU